MLQGPSTLPHTLLLKLQRNKGTIKSAALGAVVPGLRQKQLIQTHFLLYTNMIVKGQLNSIE